MDFQPNLPPADALPELKAHPVKSEDPPWNGWDVVLIGFIALIAMIVIAFFGIGVAGAVGVFKHSAPHTLDKDARLIIPLQLGAYIATFVVMYMIVARRYASPFWQTIRWNWPEKRWLGYAALGVAAAIAVQISGRFLPIPKSLPIEHFFRTPLSAYLMGVFGITAAPFIEEMFFRAFMYPVAARRMGVVGGTAFTAAAFALLHSAQLARAWAPLLLLFGVGLILTGVRARTRSVAAAFVVHVAYNFTLFFLLWLATDQFRHLERLSK